MHLSRPMRFVSLSLVLSGLILVTEQASPRYGHIFGALAVTDPLYNFTCNLFTTLNKDGKSNVSENIIVSPISIHMALNLVLLGTEQDTETGRELVHTLGYSSLDRHHLMKYHEDYERLLAHFEVLKVREKAVKSRERREGESDKAYKKRINHDRVDGPVPPVIDMFNMVITKDKAIIRPSYREHVTNYYKSKVENLGDRKQETKTRVLGYLDGWAKQAGFDSPIVKPEELDSEFVAWLLSAIRVQAFWPDKFYESNAKAIFYNLGFKSNPVNGTKLQHNFGTGAKYLKLTDEESEDKLPKGHKGDLGHLNAQVVQMPLDGGLTFTIFEPLEHSTPDDNKLEKLAKQLFGREKSILERVLGDLDGKIQRLFLTMPKFKFEKDLDLKSLLISMGLKRAFNPRQADISRMATTDVYISKAKHQAMIDVNDKGIKAAGVTKLESKTKSAQHLGHRVTINKPFVFLIRYREIPLFVGQLSSL